MIEHGLHIVATPIGNLSDISARAIEILKFVDEIVAENPRHSNVLLNKFGIQKPLISLHEHNEQEQTDNLLRKLEEGKIIAIICDAGTPLISDPGYHLVKQAHARSIRVIPIPGPSAFVCALSASGLPTDKFIFMGFLPAKQVAKAAVFQSLVEETKTIIFYEAPHRILDTLGLAIDFFGADRQAVIAREITKKFETIKKNSLNNLHKIVKNDPKQQKGEIVLLISGNISKSAQDQVQELDLAQKKIMNILLSELPINKASNLAAKITGGRKKIFYDYGLSLK